MGDYKRFVNKDKFWEIYYHTDTNELLIRKGIIGQDGIFEIQTGFDGLEWGSIYNNKIDEYSKNWSINQPILTEDQFVELRFRLYDYEGNLIQD